MTHTVRIGTRMAPSPGGAHRLMTVPTSRWFIAIMMLRPGTTVTPGQPARSESCPAHTPAALMLNVASIWTSSSVVVVDRADDGVALPQNLGDPVVGQDRGAVRLGRTDVALVS